MSGVFTNTLKSDGQLYSLYMFTYVKNKSFWRDIHVKEQDSVCRTLVKRVFGEVPTKGRTNVQSSSSSYSNDFTTDGKSEKDPHLRKLEFCVFLYSQGS